LWDSVGCGGIGTELMWKYSATSSPRARVVPTHHSASLATVPRPHAWPL